MKKLDQEKKSHQKKRNRKQRCFSWCQRRVSEDFL